jgi:hypothetical protein
LLEVNPQSPNVPLLFLTNFNKLENNDNIHCEYILLTVGSAAIMSINISDDTLILIDVLPLVVVLFDTIAITSESNVVIFLTNDGK